MWKVEGLPILAILGLGDGAYSSLFFVNLTIYSQVRDGEMVAVELVATDNKVQQKYKLWTLQRRLLSFVPCRCN
jgi:hypothetical protein